MAQKKQGLSDAQKAGKKPPDPVKSLTPEGNEGKEEEPKQPAPRKGGNRETSARIFEEKIRPQLIAEAKAKAETEVIPE